jgi:hypothetical protein
VAKENEDEYDYYYYYYDYVYVGRIQEGCDKRHFLA